MYRTYHMKDTMFKYGEHFMYSENALTNLKKSSDESEATRNESNWNCASNR